MGFEKQKIEDMGKVNINEDFAYKILYDVYPDIEYDDYKSFEIEKDEVTITEKDIDQEINQLLNNYMTYEVSDDKICDKDIVAIEYSVFENGVEIQKKDNEYIHIGKNFDFYKIGPDLIGLKKGDKKDFKKKFPKDGIETLAGKSFEFKVEIKDVKKEILPELNDQFVKDLNVGCLTVSDLKKKIETDLNELTSKKIEKMTFDNVMNKIILTFKGEIPESMVTEQLTIYWNQFVDRFNKDEKKALSILSKENKTKDSYLQDFKEDAIKDIKIALITQDVVKKEDIKATEEDLKKHLESFAKYYKTDVNELYNMYKESSYLKIFENEVETRKAQEFIVNNIKIKKGKKLNFEEFLKVNNN